MKRHVALRQLSVDHHHALVQARRLSRAGTQARRLEAASAFMEFARRSLWPHFESEEQVLLPEYARAAPDHERLAAQTLVDHLELRAMAIGLHRAQLTGGPSAEELGALSDRLEKHVRFEERQLFPAIESALSAERLAAVGVLLASGSVGPR